MDKAVQDARAVQAEVDKRLKAKEEENAKNGNFPGSTHAPTTEQSPFVLKLADEKTAGFDPIPGIGKATPGVMKAAAELDAKRMAS